MKNKIQIEPYQPYFFSGLLISMIGLGVWLLYQLNWLSIYPLQEHAFLMIMGFLLAYISGFLMTAVPKMSQTESARLWEIGFGLILLWLQVLLALSGKIQINYWIGAAQVAFLLIFVGRRFFKRKANPPMGFVFLPFGFVSGILGCLLFANSSFLSSEWQNFGRILLYQGLVLNLIAGLGSRLIPALTRVQGALDVRAQSKERISEFVLMALLLNSTFAIEAFLSSNVGLIMRAGVVGWLALRKFKILRPRQVKGNLSSGIRLSIWSLITGFLLAGVFSNYAIHFLHLSYIGGFALLTFLISTRVVLSHGGYDLTAELKSPELVWFFSLAGLIALLRVALGFEGAFRTELIVALCIAWIIMVTIWSRSFLSKLWKSS